MKKNSRRTPFGQAFKFLLGGAIGGHAIALITYRYLGPTYGAYFLASIAAINPIVAAIAYRATERRLARP